MTASFDAVLDPNNTCKAVYADKGYPSAAREAKLQAAGIRNHPLSACQERRNKRIAKIRARVEHIFAGMEHMGGKLIRTIGQARANFAMTMMAASYNLKRLSYFKRVGIEAF